MKEVLRSRLRQMTVALEGLRTMQQGSLQDEQCGSLQPSARSSPIRTSVPIAYKETKEAERHLPNILHLLIIPQQSPSPDYSLPICPGRSYAGSEDLAFDIKDSV